MALREARKKADLFAAQVARRSGVNPNTLLMYERGEKNINGAKLFTLLKLCDVLNCGLQDIITDPETLKLLKKLEIK